MIWLLPAAIAVMAAAVAAVAARSVQREVAALAASLTELAPVAGSLVAVRQQVRHTARATDLALDSIRATPRR
jgi:hypothetical protein